MGRRAGVAGSNEGMYELGGRYEWGFRVGAQFIDQRSIGDHLLTGSSFDTQSVGVRFAASINSMVLTTAITSNSDGAALRSPFGRYPVTSTTREVTTRKLLLTGPSS